MIRQTLASVAKEKADLRSSSDEASEWSSAARPTRERAQTNIKRRGARAADNVGCASANPFNKSSIAATVAAP
jgi:hypothetical protein